MDIELIKSNLNEIIGEKELEGKEVLNVYWGTAPTGKPHIGYLIPLVKIAEMVKAGCNFTILFADLHAELDSMKSTSEQVEYRTKYYNHLIKEVLKLLDVDITKINFVNGTEYQLTPEYTKDVYKFLGQITVESAQKAGAEVVKQNKNPLLSSIAYPLLQVLDEKYLKVDAQLGGIDQRKIFMLSRDHCHKINHKPIIYFMNPLLPKLDKATDNIEDKMSSSDTSKIDFLDSPKTIKKKINKSFAAPSNDNTPLLFMMKHIVFPILNLKNINKFSINRPDQYGGYIEFNTFEDLQNAYLLDESDTNNLSPQDLKLGISEFLVNFLEPLHTVFNNNDMVELISKAY